MFSAPDYHVKQIVKLVNAKAIRARKFNVGLETINASASVTAKPLLPSGTKILAGTAPTHHVSTDMTIEN